MSGSNSKREERDLSNGSNIGNHSDSKQNSVEKPEDSNSQETSKSKSKGSVQKFEFVEASTDTHINDLEKKFGTPFVKIGSQIAECYGNSVIFEEKWAGAVKLAKLLKDEIVRIGNSKFNLEMSGSIVYGCMTDRGDIDFSVKRANSDPQLLNKLHRLIFVDMESFLIEHGCKVVKFEGLVNAKFRNVLAYNFEFTYMHTSNDSKKSGLKKNEFYVEFSFIDGSNVSAKLKAVSQDDYFRILTVSVKKILARRNLLGSNKGLSSVAIAILVASYYSTCNVPFRNDLKKTKDLQSVDLAKYRKAFTNPDRRYDLEFLKFVRFVLEDWNVSKRAISLDYGQPAVFRSRKPLEVNETIVIEAFGSNNLAEFTTADQWKEIIGVFNELEQILKSGDSQKYADFFKNVKKTDA